MHVAARQPLVGAEHFGLGVLVRLHHVRRFHWDGHQHRLEHLVHGDQVLEPKVRGRSLLELDEEGVRAPVVEPELELVFQT